MNSGKKLYEKYRCASCHQAIDRTSRRRRVIAQFSSLTMIETDKAMADNVITYCSQSDFPGVPTGETCQTPKNPNKIVGGAALKHMTGQVLANGALWDLPLLAVSWFTNPIKKWIPFTTVESNRHIDFEVVPVHDTSPFENYLNVYKGRPLNGIWATAPFLHNGSVPNLYELLLPSSCVNDKGKALIPGETCRSKTFLVGNRELDTKNVGFKQEESPDYPNLFTFDTSLHGNSNKGHEYAAGKTPIIKRDLLGKAMRGDDGEFAIEYLPSMTTDERYQLVEYLKSL